MFLLVLMVGRVRTGGTRMSGRDGATMLLRRRFDDGEKNKKKKG